MSYPGISTTVSTTGIASAVEILDGVGAIIATADAVGNIGVVREVYSLADAESKGYTLAAEPFIHGILDELYSELGGNQRVFVLGTDEDTSMASVVGVNNEDGLLKVIRYSEGLANLYVVARKPPVAYDAGDDFLDADVSAAVLACKPLCLAQQQKNYPIRVLFEGRIADEDAASVYAPKTATNGFAGVVLGSATSGGRQAVGTVLARCLKYKAHVKIGSGANGALSLPNVFIGTRELKDRIDIETLHDAGFITFMKRPGSAGFYFGIDNMCSQDDFKILVHGRIIDKAVRVTASAYTPSIETEVELDDDGSIKDSDAFYLEQLLTQAIRTSLNGQISNVQVIVDATDTTFVSTHKLAVKVRVLPLGYLTYIEIDMGLTNEIVA